MLKQTTHLEDSAELELSTKKTKLIDGHNAESYEMVGANGFAMPMVKIKR